MVDFKVIYKIIKNIKVEENYKLFLSICFSIIYIGAILFMCKSLAKDASILEVFYFVTMLLLIMEKMLVPNFTFIIDYIFYVARKYKFTIRMSNKKKENKK